MSVQVELERVVRLGPKGKPAGRVHLTALVPDLGDVRTLCGQSFPATQARAVSEEPTCQLCLRRRQNPSLVSAALFEAGLGSKLLELSLQQVGERTQRLPGRPAPPEPAPPPARPRVVAHGEPEEPVTEEPARDATDEKVSELRLEGMREIGEDLYRSPAGVVVRLRRRGEVWRVVELHFEGSVLVRRRNEGRIELRVGDLQIELEGEGGTLRAIYSLR